MTHTPCVAFGAFPLQGDDACGRAKPAPRRPQAWPAPRPLGSRMDDACGRGKARSTASAGLACSAAFGLKDGRRLWPGKARSTASAGLASSAAIRPPRLDALRGARSGMGNRHAECPVPRARQALFRSCARLRA